MLASYSRLGRLAGEAVREAVLAVGVCLVGEAEREARAWDGGGRQR